MAGIATGARWATALGVTLALAACPRADRVEEATDQVYAEELVDDDELPPPPGQEVAPRLPDEVEGGIEDPGAEPPEDELPGEGPVPDEAGLPDEGAVPGEPGLPDEP